MAKLIFRTPLETVADIETEIAPGESILEAAEEAGALVGSSCGGQCACSTCHVYVVEGEDAFSEMEDGEDDRLDMAFDVRPESRLGCQARVVEESDTPIVIEISEESVKAWYDEHPAERKRVGYQGGR